MTRIHDWNAVVTVRNGAYAEVKHVLRGLGSVGDADSSNVLVLRVEHPLEMLEAIHARCQASPRLRRQIGRVGPCTRTFNFQSVAEFEHRAAHVLRGWVPDLAGRTFHVRGRLRGLRERMDARTQDRLFGQLLLDALAEAGTPGAIDFNRPDAVVAIEAIEYRAGLSLWTRDELLRYPELALD